MVDIVRDGLSAYSDTGYNYPLMATFLPISETLVTLAILAVLIGVTIAGISGTSDNYEFSSRFLMFVPYILNFPCLAGTSTL